MTFFAHDHPGAQKAHARYDVGHHAHRAVRPGDAKRHVHENGGAHADQDIRAQAGGALAILPLEAHDAAHQEGGGQTDQRVQDFVRIDGLKSMHDVLLAMVCGCPAG